MEFFLVMVGVSPIGIIAGYGIWIYRLQNKKKANLIKGRISENVYRPYSKYAAARIRLSEGPNKGKTFVSRTTVSMFGHSIGKEVNVLEFHRDNDYDYRALKSYLGLPLLIGIISTFTLLVAIWVL